MPTPRQPLTGEDLDNLNPGVRRLVAFLREQGFETVNSGDGATHLCTCDLEFPYVSIQINHDQDLIREADRLYGMMRNLGIQMQVVPEMADPHDEVPEAEATEAGTVDTSEKDDHECCTVPQLPFVDVYYNPAVREGELLLAHVTDAMLPAELPPPTMSWMEYLRPGRTKSPPEVVS